MTRARDLAAFVSNADGDIKFDTDTLFIDSSANRVGIGTDTPASVLHVKGRTLAVDGAAASDSPRLNLDLDGTNKAGVRVNRVSEDLEIDVVGSNNITFDTNSAERMRITNDGLLTGNNHQIDILDGSGDVSMRLNNLSSAQNSGRIQVDPDNTGSGSMLAIYVDGTEEARFDSDGLKFNGDSAAQNALSDYEEGNFTPTSGVSLTSVSTVYRKIGKLVHVGMKFTMGSSSSGSQATISGLPFANVSNNASRAGLVVGWNSNGIGAGLTFLLGEGTTTGVFYLDGTARSYAQMANKTVYIGGTYPTAS